MNTGVCVAYDTELVSKLVRRMQLLGYTPEDIQELISGDGLERARREIRSQSKFDLVKIVHLAHGMRSSVEFLSRNCGVTSAFANMFAEVVAEVRQSGDISCYKLVNYSPSQNVAITLLGGRERAVVTLAHMQALIDLQPRPSVPGVLHGRHWNVFHLEVADGEVQQVVIGKDVQFDRWEIDLHTDSRLWMVGTRFFGLC